MHGNSLHVLSIMPQKKKKENNYAFFFSETK